LFMESIYYVYVLRNMARKHYIGGTEDLQRQLTQHNSGVSTWTRSRGPWEMVWNSPPLSLRQARKLEVFLKKQKGGIGFYNYTGLPRNGS